MTFQWGAKGQRRGYNIKPSNANKGIGTRLSIPRAAATPTKMNVLCLVTHRRLSHLLSYLFLLFTFENASALLK